MSRPDALALQRARMHKTAVEEADMDEETYGYEVEGLEGRERSTADYE